jgi:preprotein translocase subunit YajC
LFWAVLVHGFLISSLLIVFNSGILKFDFINKHDSAVLNIILDNNLFVLPIVFLSRFYYLLYRNKKESKLYYISSRPLILASKVITSILFVLTVLAMFNILVIKQLDKAIFLLLPAIMTWVWSTEKTENAEVENIRLRAMYLSVTFNYSAFIVLTWVIYGINYLAVLYIGLASIPLAFIPIFYWLKFRDKQHRAQGTLV